MSSKNLLPSNILKLLIIFVLFIYTYSAQAACKRDDVDHYLSRGFSHEQIVKLCVGFLPSEESTEHSSSPEPTSIHSPTTIQHEHQSKDEEKNEDSLNFYSHPDAIFLATAIEGYDVEITPDAIIFFRKECFDFGDEDWNGFKDRTCLVLKYSIKRKGLSIVERDNGFFGMGGTALYISGHISPTIINIDEYDKKSQKIMRKVVRKQSNKLKINVRSGMPMYKVEEVLLKLAKA